jgi:hypothetical protein
MSIVAIILDSNFGDCIEQLVREMPVWVISSEANRTAIQRVWDSGTSEGRATIFEDKKVISREQLVLDIIGDVEEHHPACKNVLVMGLQMSAGLAAALEDNGFVAIESNQNGFKASKG